MLRRQRTPAAAAARPYIQRAAQGSRARQTAFVARRAPAPRPYRGLPAGVEYKAIDVSNPNAQVTNAGGVVLLNGCARGDDIGSVTAARSQCAQSTSAWKSSQLAQRLAPTPPGHHLRGQAGQRHCPHSSQRPRRHRLSRGHSQRPQPRVPQPLLILSDKVYGFGCDYGGAGVGVQRLVATRFWRSFAVKTTFNSAQPAQWPT